MNVVTKTEIAVISTPKPLEFKFRQHTVEDLMGIKLEPSKYIVRLTLDHIPPYISPLTYDKLKKAFVTYNTLATKHGHEAPKFIHYFDQLRWNLRCFLIRHKVII